MATDYLMLSATDFLQLSDGDYLELVRDTSITSDGLFVTDNRGLPVLFTVYDDPVLYDRLKFPLTYDKTSELPLFYANDLPILYD